MNLRKCFEKGLLVKERASGATVRSTLQLARHTLGRAEGNFGMEYFDVALSSRTSLCCTLQGRSSSGTGSRREVTSAWWCT